jgi:AraC-like DNA-binding protein
MMSRMSPIISHLHIANAVLCLLLAAQLLTMSARHPVPKRILAFNCLLYAHQSIALVAILNAHASIFALTRPLFAMLLGPCLYIYFLCVRRQQAQLHNKDIWHFVIGILVFLLLSQIKPLRIFIDFAILASFFIYTGLIAIQIRNGEHLLSHLGEYAKSAYQWLVALMLLALVNILLEIAVNVEIQTGTALRDSISLLIASIIFLTINFSIMFAALKRSNWLEWMYQFDAKNLQITSLAIAPDLAQQLFQRWETLVKTEQLHKQEFGITLPQAAKKLHIPARQLSNAINQIYGKSFSVYLNDLRIQEAQRLLIETPEMTVIEVMQESGFSSKSNFNKEFLRVTGLSPSKFREEQTNKTSSE